MSTKVRFEIEKEITQDVIDAIIPNPTKGLVVLPEDSCDVQVQFTSDCSEPLQVTVTLVATNISPNSSHIVQVQDSYGNWQDTNQALLTFENKCIDNSTNLSLFYQAVTISSTLQGNGLYSIIISSPLFDFSVTEQQDFYDFIDSCKWFFRIFGFFGTVLDGVFVGNYTVTFYMPAVSNLSVSNSAITFDYNPNTTNTDTCNTDEYNESQSFVQNIASTPFNYKDINNFICLDKYTKPRSSRAKFRVIKCDDTISLYEATITDWQNPCPATISFLGTTNL